MPAWQSTAAFGDIGLQRGRLHDKESTVSKVACKVRAGPIYWRCLPAVCVAPVAGKAHLVTG